LGGRSQAQIAQDLNMHASEICTALMRFYEFYGSQGPDFTHIQNYNQRRDCYFSQALIRYLKIEGEVSQPAIRRQTHYRVGDEDGYSQARYEHAWLLRAEGLTLHQVGAHLGITKQRARQLISSYGRRVGRAMRRTRFEWMA
jgi:hypothetical protein